MASAAIASAVGLTVYTALIPALAWASFEPWLMRTCKPVFGSRIVNGGGMRWQCATKLWTQLVVLPSLFLLSLSTFAFSMQAWSDACALALFPSDGTRFYDWAFGYIFTAYMIEGAPRARPVGRATRAWADEASRRGRLRAPRHPPDPLSRTLERAQPHRSRRPRPRRHVSRSPTPVAALRPPCDRSGRAWVADVIVATKLDALMTWHHVGCLLGYYIAFSAIPSGYPYFFAGCIAFEVGSAAFNVYCLYPSRPMAAFFSTAMTVSNAVAFYLAAGVWVHHPTHFGAKAFGLALSTLFVLLRQKECINEIRAQASSAGKAD